MIEVGGGIKASPEGDKPSVRMWGRGPSRLPGLWVALAVAFVCTGLSIVMLQRLLVARGHASLSPAQAAQKLDEPYAHFFHKTVLIVNVNYEAVAEKTTAFWRKYYSRFFRHIVILCKRPLPHIGVEAVRYRYPVAPGLWRGSVWAYHYGALPRLLQRFPNAEGLLWTNDDVVINYWNLLKGNKTKLWLPNNSQRGEYTYFDLYTPNGSRTHANDWGAAAVYQEQARKALDSMPKRYRDRYFQSTGGRKVYHKRVCDLFYIPNRLFPVLGKELIPAVYRAGMLSEMALPMAFMAAEDPKEWDPVLDDMVYNWELLWRTNLSFNPKDRWSPNVSAFHPWKVSSPIGRTELLRALAGVDPAVEMLFPESVHLSVWEWVQQYLDRFRWEVARFKRFLEGRPL